MPDLLDLLGPSTKEPREVMVEMMESIKIPEERNGKLVDVLLPELLLPLLNERRLVLLRVLVVRSHSISVKRSIGYCWALSCMYVCITSIMSAGECEYQEYQEYD